MRLKPTFGTCAGAILLATEVENPKQAGLGALDIRIRRNAYGRQLDSSIREGKLLPAAARRPPESPLEMVFIRAPKIERVGPDVEVLATEGKETQSPSGREVPWPPPSIPNSPMTPASTRHFSVWSQKQSPDRR